MNVAVTVLAEVIDTVHDPVPEQPPPLQPLNVEPPSGAAVSVTAVPWANVAAQVGPQLMPAGDDAIAPPPVPAVVTVSV